MHEALVFPQQGFEFLARNDAPGRTRQPAQRFPLVRGERQVFSPVHRDIQVFSEGEIFGEFLVLRLALPATAEQRPHASQEFRA